MNEPLTGVERHAVGDGNTELALRRRATFKLSNAGTRI